MVLLNCAASVHFRDSERTAQAPVRGHYWIGAIAFRPPFVIRSSLTLCNSVGRHSFDSCVARRQLAPPPLNRPELSEISRAVVTPFGVVLPSKASPSSPSAAFTETVELFLFVMTAAPLTFEGSPPGLRTLSKMIGFGNGSGVRLLAAAQSGG